MENKKKENKIQKDFYQLLNFRFAVIILVFILTIVATLFWVYTINKERKAKPILPPGWGPNPGSGNDAPLLTIGDIDESQASNGYALSGLGQPCRDDQQKGGVPNLPGAFVPQPCDSSKDLVCTAGVFKGNICLSNIGGYCLTLNDCVPGADECINNTCTQKGDTINQKCLTDNDCRSIIQKYTDLQEVAQYNHVCQLSNTQKYGYCKVNRYPFDSGCRSNSDCIEGSFCSNDIGAFEINVKSDQTFNFTDNGICWGDINGLIAILNKSNQATYEINNWNGTTGSLKPSGTNTTQANVGKNNITLGANNLGICLEKIPAGGPANLNLGGINIPCQDGLINIENFCLPTQSPNAGQVCVNPEVKCKDFITPPDSQGNTVRIPLSCLYDFNTEQGLVNDYYYGLSQGAFSIYKVGKCAEAIRKKDESCENITAGCEPPFICISENDQNGDIISICNTPFKAQICVNGQCPDGYECANPAGSPPLCKGKTNTFCLQDNDCISSNGCGQTYNINTFGPSSGTITNRLALPNDFNTEQQDVHLVLSYNVDENLVPTTQLAWYQDKTNNYLYHIYIKNDSQNINKSFTVTLPSDKNYQLKQILIDEDDNVLFFHKHDVTDTMRLRCYAISKVFSGSEFGVTSIRGFYDGMTVFFNRDNAMVPNSAGKIYTASIDFTSLNISLTDSSGAPVAISSTSDLGNLYLCTYDNRYGTVESGDVIIDDKFLNPFIMDLVYNTDNNCQVLPFYTGDRITYQASDSNNPALIKSLLPPLSSSGTSYYRTQTFPLINGTSYYTTVLGAGVEGTNGFLDMFDLVYTSGVNVLPGTITYALSDSYYSAAGGYPTLEGKKIMQYGITFPSNEDYFILNNEGFYTYGLTAFSLDQIKNINNNATLDFNNYISINNDLSLNGINQGITYLYNDGTDQIEFNSKKIDNKNFLIANKPLTYNNKNHKDNDNSYINQIMLIEYDIEYSDILQPTSDAWNYDNKNLNNIYISNNGVNACKLNFTLQETSAVNEHKGFYHSNDINENIVNNISLNENGSYFYTLEHDQDLANKSENSIAIINHPSLFDYTPDANNDNIPEVEYSNFTAFDKLEPLPFSGVKFISERANNENYYTGEGNLIYIYNQEDINNILNFSSSEIVISGVSGNSIDQITWAIVSIKEYEVTLDTEYMIIETQVPIVYESSNTLIDNINKLKNWKLYVYNFVPLKYSIDYLNGDLNPNGTNSISDQNNHAFAVIVSDASLLFTSTKVDNFFRNNLEFSFLRTGFHNLMLKNIVPTGGGLKVNTNTYSIFNLNDGVGVKYEDPGQGGTAFYAEEPSYSGTGTSFYDTTFLFDFFDNGTRFDATNIFPILPSKMNFMYAITYYRVGDFQNRWFLKSYNDANEIIIDFGGSININFFNIPFSNQFLYFYPFPQSSRTKNEFAYYPQSNQSYDDNFDPGLCGAYFYDPDDFYSQYSFGSTPKFPINSGFIKLPIANYTNELYATNDLFLSSLPLGDSFFINSNPVVHDNIVVTLVDGVYKNLGNISLYQNAMAHYQTGTNKNPSYFNENNQVAISWPTWLKTRYNNEKNEIPRIRKVVVDHAKGNIYGQATYYAFVEFDNTVSLVYLNNENSNFTLAQNQGVATTVSIFDNQISSEKLKDVFVMSSPSRNLYTLGNGCKP